MTKELYHVTSIQFAKGVVSGLTVFRGSEPFGYYFEVKNDGITNSKIDDRKDAQEVLSLLREQLNNFVLECNKINIELNELPSRN